MLDSSARVIQKGENMELGEAICSAVTTRYFTDEPVTDEQLQAAFNYARFAPQGGNRQPVRFIVVRDQDKRNQLAEWYRVPWKAYLADAETGDIEWEQILNSSAGGFPVSYMHDGVQYIAIAAGGGVNYRSVTPEIEQPPRGNTLFVFRLP